MIIGGPGPFFTKISWLEIASGLSDTCGVLVIIIVHARLT